MISPMDQLRCMTGSSAIHARQIIDAELYRASA